VVYQLNFDVFKFLQSSFLTITKFAENFGGFGVIHFIMCVTYSMGISTWLLFAVLQPVFFFGIQENMNAIAAGLPATYITTNEVFYSGWLAFGGTGATLTLTILLLLSKVKSLKSLGAASIFPSILNINEPVVFGCVAWNPILMVPMWIHGIVLPVITYIALRLGLAAIPSSVFGMWYCPFPISTWIVSKSVGGLLLLAVLVALSFIIWLPFLRVYEKQLTKKEAAEQV
jgi:PTS system cellobiose-specific IIC component